MIFSTDETELTEKKVDHHVGNCCTGADAMDTGNGGGGRRNKHFWKLSKNMYKL